MTKYNRLSSRKNAVFFNGILTSCLIVFLSLLFSFPRVSTAADSTDYKISAGNDGSSNTTVLHESRSSHLPIGPGETPLELKNPNEGESSEDTDEEIKHLFDGLWLGAYEQLHSENPLFAHLKISIENRPSLSLFILYQSWKVYQD